MKPSLWDLKLRILDHSQKIRVDHEAIPMGFETLNSLIGLQDKLAIMKPSLWDLKLIRMQE